MAKQIQVILQQQVNKLGQKGDIVKVSAGYARNYLLPQKLAVLATKKTIKAQEKKAESLEQTKHKEASLLSPILQQLEDQGVGFACHANEKGQLFGSIDLATIAKSLSQKYQIQLDKKTFLELVNIEKGIIRHLGEYQAQITFSDLPGKPQVVFPIQVRVLKR
jgi:large subunit ribosomal protein L9